MPKTHTPKTKRIPRGPLGSTGNVEKVAPARLQFSERVEDFLALYRFELAFYVGTKAPETSAYTKLEELQAHLKDLQSAGQSEDQLVLCILDALVTGLRYGNW